VDRGQLFKLTEPTILRNGKRIPGLKLDHPRQLALMQALVRFSHLAAQDSFSTTEVHADTAAALGRTTADYRLASLRYDLSKLRAKGLVDRLNKSRRYRLTSEGYRLCVVYLKLFEKLYAPLTSGILKPFKHDARVHNSCTSLLDRLYTTVARALDLLADAVGLQAA
jgi:DNA-binding transcriptional ArsR family regulator